ncbi:MAG: selenium cofactor biosynthesis protein YqeC [Halodesulfurarchaeum sp.]
MDLIDTLGVSRGMTTVVGAGGKKTLLYRLAKRLDRAILTASVRIPIFDDEVSRVVVTPDPVSALSDRDVWPLGLVPDREDDRYHGYDPAVLSDLRQTRGNDPILVKGDGARNREFKAPGTDEPKIPQSTDTVVAVASVKAIGQPLEEATVHRPKRVTALTARQLGETITPDDVATVLASDRGGRKNVPKSATFVVLLNKVDDEHDMAKADAVAASLRSRESIHQVVSTRLIDERSPIVNSYK